jgi:hypothetical protein
MIPLARYDFSINWSVGGIRKKIRPVQTQAGIGCQRVSIFD